MSSAHARRHRAGVLTKSSLMLGLGETAGEIRETMQDLRASRVDLLTLGQYLRPTRNHLPVERWVHPEEFEEYRRLGLSLGFMEVASGPLVRSSYRADRILRRQQSRPGTGTRKDGLRRPERSLAGPWLCVYRFWQRVGAVDPDRRRANRHRLRSETAARAGRRTGRLRQSALHACPVPPPAPGSSPGCGRPAGWSAGDGRSGSRCARR